MDLLLKKPLVVPLLRMIIVPKLLHILSFKNVSNILPCSSLLINLFLIDNCTKNNFFVTFENLPQ